MSEHWNNRQNMGHRLLVVLVAISLVGTVGVAFASGLRQTGQTAAPQPWAASPALGPDGQPQAYSPANAVIDPAAPQLAATFTDRVFWIVVGLVVLGSLVLMADFPETE